MKAKLGNLSIFLGAALILSALALVLYNRQEAARAERASAQQLAQLLEQIENNTPSTESTEIVPGTPVEYIDPSELVMTEAVINGHSYIGYLSIPELELELPVMSGWSYDKLQISPCRFTGTLLGEDLVIMAHNYPKHFGRIADLTEGSRVIFTDMDGEATIYEVAAMDILDPGALDEIISGEFDLTLFTCTYGGEKRVTVYCDFATSK